MLSTEYDPAPFNAEYERLMAAGLSSPEAVEVMRRDSPHLFKIPPLSRTAAAAPAAVATGTRWPAKLEAKAAWDNAVAAKMAGGLTRERAASAVVREQPHLQKQLICAYNPPAATPRPTAGYTCADFRRLQASWRDAIAGNVKGGMNAYAATTTAAKNQQALREELVAAGNQHQRLIKAGRCTCPRGVRA